MFTLNLSKWQNALEEVGWFRIERKELSEQICLLFEIKVTSIKRLSSLSVLSVLWFVAVYFIVFRVNNN